MSTDQAKTDTTDCYVINLERSKDRWEKVLQSFSIPGLNLIRVEAVEGSRLTFPHKDYAEQKYSFYHGKRVNPSEVGCFFSHIKAIRTFLESDAEFALICEDDISATPSLMKLIHRALRYQSLWDLLRLNCLKVPYGFSVRSLGDGYTLNVAVSWAGGTGAYLINRKAAERIAQYSLPMCVPYDHIFEQSGQMGINVAFVKPFPIMLNETSGNTTIYADHSIKFPFFRRYFLTMTLL